MEYNVNDFNLEQVKLEAKLNLANEELRRVLEAKDIINKAALDTVVKLSSENYNEKIMKKIIINNNNALQRASGCMGIKNDYNLSTETNNLQYEVNLSIEGIGDFFKNIWEFILKIIKTIWNIITGFFKALYNFFFGTKKSLGSLTSNNSSATSANTKKVNDMINNIANGNNVNATQKDLNILPKVEKKLEDFLEKNNRRNRIFFSLIMENGEIDIKKYFLNQCDQYSKYIDVLQKKINVINSFCGKYIDNFSTGTGYNADILFEDFKIECSKMLEGYDGIDFGFTDLVKNNKINRFDYSTVNIGYRDFIKKNSITILNAINEEKIIYKNSFKLREASYPFDSRNCFFTNAVSLIKDTDIRERVYDELDDQEHDYRYISTYNEIELKVDNKSNYKDFIKKHCDKRDMINIVDLKNYKNAEIMMDDLTNEVKKVIKKITDVKDYTVKDIEDLNRFYNRNDNMLRYLLFNINHNNFGQKTEHLYYMIVFSELLSKMFDMYVGHGMTKNTNKFDFDKSEVSFETKSDSGFLNSISKSFINFSSRMNKFITDYIGFATDVYKIVDGKDLPTRADQQQTQTIDPQVQQTNP